MQQNKDSLDEMLQDAISKGLIDVRKVNPIVRQIHTIFELVRSKKYVYDPDRKNKELWN